MLVSDAKVKINPALRYRKIFFFAALGRINFLEKNGLFQSERGARADVGGRCPYEHLKFSGFSHPFVSVGIKIGEGGARD